MAELYLAYASDDVAYARELYDALTSRGITVFFDKVDVAFGEDAMDAMDIGFEGNLAFMLVWSERAVKAPFLKIERIESVYNAVKGSTQLIMPVRLDDTPLPRFVRSRSYRFMSNPSHPDGETAAGIADAALHALNKYRHP